MGAALDVVNRFYEAFAAGDMQRADDCFSDDCRYVMPPGPLTKAEHRQMAETFKAALPDAHMAIDHAVDGGDEVFVEGRFLGTHDGDLVSPQGTIPASGSKLELRFADYFKVAAGQVVEHRTYWDQMDMMGQLGATG